MRGSSVEFAQHKEYSPGDELRHLDWKVYAKADRYYIKQFEQESELTAHLVLDASGSMSYRGDRLSKIDYGAQILAALAYLLIHQRDKVGFYAFGDRGLDRMVPARARPAHLRDVLAVMTEVCDHGAAGDEPLSDALEKIGEIAGRKRRLVVVASDLFDPSTRAVEVLRSLRARGHDVVVFQTLDRDEFDLPFEGLTLFESLESPRRLLTNPSAIRRAYRERMDTFLKETDEALKQGGVEYHLTPTDRPLVQTIREFIQRRLGGRK